MQAKELKQLIFIFLVVAVIAVLFVVLQNAAWVMQNLVIVVPALVIIYLIARYDYVLQLRDYERAVVFTLGRVNRVGGPGWAVVFPPLESYEVVDLRTRAIDIPKQDIITKDNIEVNVDAVIYLRVNKDNASVINSITAVQDYIQASKLFLMGLIRDKAGSLNLNELISKVSELNVSLKEGLEKIAKDWGVVVDEVTIKDINLPRAVIEAMHEEKAAEQRKLARIQGAEAHQAEIEAVKNAAENLSDRALAYYYVRALEKLGEGKSTKFIFPLELSRLAESLSGKNLSEGELESLMKKYAPLVKSLAGKKTK